MSNKYDNIQLLIELWQDFESMNKTLTFEKFGNWLIENQKGKNFQSDSEIYEPINNKSTVTKTEVEASQHFLILISRLSRFQEYYTKKLFEGLPLNTLLEFNFLHFINKNNSLKKKEVIDHHLVEYTTGIDIIKRLIKSNLVAESKDETDKRSKLLRITTAGKKVLIDALITYKKMDYVFFGKFSELKWKESIPILQEMEDYHSEIFTECSNHNVYDIMECIQSKMKN